ncbi:SRPBCC domain-containing protein [Novosphingobium beihaiensis]|uniref:SRPBCC domain-containing protein n=1 Tax=Novosphingobium beihaiensis TaxID=2930389 RepID=A0ABT0BNH6_9SPHN|nr:SRPBCC domain-containing protein [Novosphingobium beihaiensis]MCJ2186610.1 SRPBCC domain-containing protein [Novosphingobium beihaiensis]
MTIARQNRGTSRKTGGRCTERRIEIGAPPELVWDFLADFEGWGAWNPLYIETNGRAEPGERIRFAVKLEGMKPGKGHGTIGTVKPNELLEYTMASFGGLMKIHRYIAVEEISPTRCTVINGEVMSGPMSVLVYRAVGEKVARGFEGMNEALRKVAEQKWMGQA